MAAPRSESFARLAPAARHRSGPKTGAPGPRHREPPTHHGGYCCRILHSTRPLSLQANLCITLVRHAATAHWKTSERSGCRRGGVYP